MKINNTKYNMKKSRSIYSNRSAIIQNDEEIVLLLGNEIGKENTVDVETAVYLSLPSFLRLYDTLKEKVDKFREGGNLI
ncbi:DUF3467 domain-containing protein [Brachyspira hampsonii]|uniref:Uncharacterized protein n=1 Tax=Brachyspira hampsonii 30446 TaxID=1289135 RepID=A0A2U4F2X9_9SPIR|nr:DUF3467 domain-containing protein [Brachyspira hampsonii]EKV57749.1 hypothetical protein A966_04140 [Brachyspira hampsonii 30446]MBW5388634.1 hypothetical protein [Brachyspira hampsonii]MBW5395910.1 hypothetical protein [Brachyspira hampsonii]OEJ18497.1 hypothetical protein A9495_05980 [Brachyspira hampsonii]PTY41142.1 hypothetical protein DQ06_11610 [Brachyspira hampsonii bv. II]